MGSRYNTIIEASSIGVTDSIILGPGIWSLSSTYTDGSGGSGSGILQQKVGDEWVNVLLSGSNVLMTHGASYEILGARQLRLNVTDAGGGLYMVAKLVERT